MQGSSIKVFTIFLLNATQALAYVWRIWWRMTHLTASLFFHTSVDPSLCIHLCNEMFMHHNPPLISHPSISYITYTLKGIGGLEPISDDDRQEVGTHWTGLQSIKWLTYRDKQWLTLIFTPHGSLELPINLTCMSLDWGRKPEFPEETHAGTQGNPMWTWEEHANSCQPFELQTFLLLGNIAKHRINVLPQHILLHEAVNGLFVLTNACASLSLNKRRRPQFLTIFTEVFPIDLNADAAPVTVPIETIASWVVFVAEAPVIWAPTMSPFAILMQN